VRHVVLISATLVAITLAVYMQLGNHEFISYDDPSYVTDNLHVSSGITGENVIWAFTSFDEANWHPVTWLSHMTDVQLYGMNPRGHHLTSLVIHSITSLLLLYLLLRCTGSLWQSSLVAALFALHPLHVESVAWVAERKDVLSAFFWFLTLLLYAEYVAKRKQVLYVWALFSFVLGLMSKPMIVTLPIVMLLMDFWPLKRYWLENQEQGQRKLLGKVMALINEKIPFFACSLISGVITIYAQHTGGTTLGLDEMPFIARIQNALIVYVTYIIKTFWPHDLAVLYPIQTSFPLWQVIVSLCVLLLISAAAIKLGRRFSYLPMGWFWFIITLLPVIGLLQVGRQSMADRYTYIPVIGLFIMVAWGIPDLIRGLQYRERILALLASVAIVSSITLTLRQLDHWRNSISLYRHTLQVTSNNCIIHNNLGVSFLKENDLDAAIREFMEAIAIQPNYIEARLNLGMAHSNKGNLDAAIKEFKEALAINPVSAEAYFNLGTVLLIKGDLDAAINEFKEALAINPVYMDSHNNLGAAFVRKGNLDAAIEEYQLALRIDPNNSTVHNNLGSVLERKGHLDAAIKEYQIALRITPSYTEAYNNLSFARAKKRMLEETGK